MRCYREENHNYKDYGGRGITVCDEWRTSYKNFYDWSLSNGYTDGLSLDRIDNNGNYEPSNCRWATRFEQASNTRRNVFYTIGKETHILSQWARVIGRSRNAVHGGLKRYGIAYLEKRLLEKNNKGGKNGETNFLKGNKA